VTSGQALARAGLVVSGAFLISRILGYVRIVVIGHMVGQGPVTSADLDAFFAAFRLPDLIFQLVAAGALSSALIPLVSGLLAKDEEQRAWRMISTVINLMLIALAALAITLFIFAPTVVRAITPGFDQPQLDRTVELTRIMVLGSIFLALGAVATSVLQAADRFVASAVAPIIYNLAIIGAALLLGPTLGVEALAIGVVVGSLGHVLVQVRPLGRLGFRYEPRIDGHDPLARQALILMVPRALGLGATQITFIVVTALASTLGVGVVSDFNFAFTLMQIPLGIIGVPLGIIVLPSLSREAAAGHETAFVALLTRSLRLLVYVMVPIAMLTAVLRQQVVDLLFGGSRIGDQDLSLIATTLAGFLVGLAAHAMIAVLARAFYARQDTLTPVLAAVGAVVINSTLAVVFVGPLHLGLGGIALAIAIAAWVEAAALLVMLRIQLPHFHLAGLGRVSIEAILGSMLASAAAIGLLQVLGGLLGLDLGWPAQVLEISVVSAGFALVYAVVSLALRIPELPTIVRLMTDALRRRPARS